MSPWIQVTYGDVQSASHRVPELPDGRYIHESDVERLRLALGRIKDRESGELDQTAAIIAAEALRTVA